MSFRVLALAPILLSAAQVAPLRRPLVADTTESYISDLDLNLNADLPNGMGAQTLTLKSKLGYVLKTGVVDGRKAAATLTTTVKSYELGGSLAAFLPSPPEPVPTEQKGTIDDLNRLRVETPKVGDLAATIIATQINAVSALLLELPEAAVAEGGEWDVTVPKGPFTGKEDQILKAKWLGKESIDGVETYRVSIVGPLKVEVDGAAFAGANVTSKGSANVESIANIDPKTGRTIKFAQKFTTSADVSASGLEAKVSGTGTLVTVLAK